MGVRVDLAPGREAVNVDIESEPTLMRSGPGVAPMAVAAIFHLYGPAAMIEHPVWALSGAPDGPHPINWRGHNRFLRCRPSPCHHGKMDIAYGSVLERL